MVNPVRDIHLLCRKWEFSMTAANQQPFAVKKSTLAIGLWCPPSNNYKQVKLASCLVDVAFYQIS